MTNANRIKPLPKSLLKRVVIILGLATLTACSNSTLRMSKELKETPSLTRTNMTDAIGCLGSSLKKSNSNSAYLFLIRDITDGTVKDSVYQDSPLSDSGRLQLQNVLSEHLYPHVGLVMDNFPLIFTQMGKEGIGLNRLGLPSTENLNAFMVGYAPIIQSSRQAKKLPPANNIVPLVVSGSFTRFDTDNMLQAGSGQNFGSRTKRLADDEVDDIWNTPTGQADIGNTSSAKAISLVLNLIDPRNNLVVSSQSFDLIFYRQNRTFRLRVGLGEGFYGVSRSKVIVEGVHAAQKTLLDAAAFWLLNKAYGGQTNFSSCFTSDEQRQLTKSSAQVKAVKSPVNPALKKK